MDWLDMNCMLKTRCQDGGLQGNYRDREKAGAVQVTSSQEEEGVTVWDRKMAAIPKLGSSVSSPRRANTGNEAVATQEIPNH